MHSAAQLSRKPIRPLRERKKLTELDLPFRRFTVKEYHELIDAGILSESDRCELIHGWIIDLIPPNPAHSQATRIITRELSALLAHSNWILGIQDVISLSESETMPDAYIALGPESNYQNRHPGPDDLALVVEVSNTSLRLDRGVKLALYAAEGIPQYWIIDVKAQCIEVYTQPRGGKKPGYKKKEIYSKEDKAPIMAGGKRVGTIPVAKLLPGIGFPE